MEMNSFSTEDLCNWLDKKLIQPLWKASKVRQLVMFTTSHLFPNVLVNEIDGEALALLMDDIQEFSHIIPRAVSRLKIKKLVRELSNPTIDVEVLYIL